MNSKKYLSALLLTLTLASSQALKAQDYDEYDYSNYSLGGIIDSALEAPRDIIEGAADVADEATDTAADIIEEPVIIGNKPVIFGDEEIIAEEPEQYANDEEDELALEEMNASSDEDSSDEAQEYSYNTYGALDADNIDSDYNPELE